MVSAREDIEQTSIFDMGLQDPIKAQVERLERGESFVVGGFSVGLNENGIFVIESEDICESSGTYQKCYTLLCQLIESDDDEG